MARTIAPLFGFDASGKIGGSLVFAKWKGRPYVRRLVIPKNPKSPKQVSVRSMMTFLSQQWKNLDPAEQLTWDALAEQLIVSPFNAYTKVDQKRWGNFSAPGKTNPVLETGTLPAGTSLAALGGVLQATITTDLSTPNDGWGILIFRSLTTGFATGFANLVKVNLHDTATDQIFVDTPLAAGTYFYNARPFTDDGLLGPEVGEESAVVTAT